MNRQYKKSPLVEALCEFQFIPGQPWDVTIPDLFYEKISGEFPIKKQQLGVGISFQPRGIGIAQEMEMLQRIQFFKTDETALVQVGINLLAINQLKPYPSWNAFKPLILQNLTRYLEIAKPKGFKRIGLRYINKIEFDKDSIELGHYLKYSPFIPPELPQKSVGFHFRVEIPYQDGRDHLVVILASAIPQKANCLSLFLDLDYFIAKPDGISLDQAPDWIEQAHSAVENAFEACITDECRKLFGEET